MRLPRRAVLAACLLGGVALGAHQPDYRELWEQATPFDAFLRDVRSHKAAWSSRFANAAIDADMLNDVRLLPPRNLLVVADGGCSDSVWTVPYIAKLAAAVPERLDLRVIGRRAGSRIQSANITSDGRIATPVVVVLDEHYRPVGAWVERPSELQKWFIEHKATMDADALHEQMEAWYAADAGRATLREIVALLKKS